MTLPTNDEFARCELAASDLEAISAGLIPRFLGPPAVAGGHEGAHHPPHCSPPPRYYPGGGPNAPGLHVHT